MGIKMRIPINLDLFTGFFIKERRNTAIKPTNPPLELEPKHIKTIRRT